MIKLEDYTIKQYAEMLKEQKASNSEILKEIDSELSKQLQNFGSGQNVGLFLLQKDLLILECKLVLAIFDFDKEAETKLRRRIDKLKTELSKISKPTSNKTPYRSFLSWILSVEKYFGKDFSYERDLLYLVEATTQMLTFYENQKQQLEKQKVKK